MPALPEKSPAPTPTSAPRSMNKYTGPKILVAAGLLIWLVRSGRLDFHVLLSAPLSVFHFLGVAVLFIAMVLQAWRWRWLLRVQRIDLPFRRVLGVIWIGRFLALVLPGAVGGDLVRGYYIIQEAPSTRMAGLSTVLLDRVLGLFASFLLGIASLAWMLGSREPVPESVLRMGFAMVVMLVGVCVFFSILWCRRTRAWILRWAPARSRAPLEGILEAYRVRGSALRGCIALSLVIGAVAMGAFVFAGYVVGTPISWKQAFLVCPLVFVAVTLPISPGGVGVGETAASVLFAPFGVETGAAMMLIVRLWFLVLWLPGGVLYVLQRRHAAAPEPAGSHHPEGIS